MDGGRKLGLDQAPMDHPLRTLSPPRNPPHPTTATRVEWIKEGTIVVAPFTTRVDCTRRRTPVVHHYPVLVQSPYHSVHSMVHTPLNNPLVITLISGIIFTTTIFISYVVNVYFRSTKKESNSSLPKFQLHFLLHMDSNFFVGLISYLFNHIRFYTRSQNCFNLLSEEIFPFYPTHLPPLPMCDWPGKEKHSI